MLLCYGGGSIKKAGIYDEAVKILKEEDIEIFELSGIAPNPKIESVREGVKLCKENDIDMVLAIGGGSVIDLSLIHILIQNEIEDVLADKILEGTLSNGQTMTIGKKDKKLTFSVKETSK